MKVFAHRLQLRGMNARKRLCIGIVLLGSGCLTDPGDLGALGESSGGAEDGGSGPGSETAETSASTAAPSGTTTAAPSGTGSESGTEEGGSTGDSIEPECTLDVGAGLQRRMTESQFEHALWDLFAVDVDVALGAGAGPVFDQTDTYGAAQLTEIQGAAQSVAAQFVVPPCAGADCGQTFIDAWAPLVLRGQEDTDGLFGVFESEASYEQGVRAVVEAMIVDPAFSDLTPTGTMDGPLLVLDGTSLATRLSLLVWNSVPNAQLMDAVEDLSAPGGVDAALQWMLEDPKYGRAQADLYGMLTKVRDVPSVDRSTTDPAWSEQMGESMLEEQRRFVGSLAEDDAATFETLMTSTSTFVDDIIAGLYGQDLQTPAPPPGSWAAGELDTARRAGLLTQVGFLTRHARDLAPNAYQGPIRRGLAVVESLVCVSVPPPPPDVADTPLGPITDRESYEGEVHGHPECAACHELFDPMGHAFGNYDGLGRWYESGDSLSDQSSFPELEFEDAVDLSAQMASDGDVQLCMAQRQFEFALRRSASEQDACTIDVIAEAFIESGGNLRTLVQATATSEAFGLARP